MPFKVFRSVQPVGRHIPTRPRPLSPHLGIYKSQYTSRLSISHRVSGCALSFVLLLGTVFLGCASTLVTYGGSLIGTSLGDLIVVGLPALGNGIRLCRRLSIIYHRINGCRHLLWDTGNLLAKDTIEGTSKLILGLSLLVTAVVYGIWRY